MVSCEQFESNFEAWKSDKLSPELQTEMSRHASECPYCGALCGDTVRLRALLGSLPKLEPSPGFEFRLRNRLKERMTPETERRRGYRRIPRWAALGAGLATGVVIGVVILAPSDKETPGLNGISPSAPAIALSEPGIMPAEDTLAGPTDTASVPEPLFSPDRHSQAVSTER